MSETQRNRQVRTNTTQREPLFRVEEQPARRSAPQPLQEELEGVGETRIRPSSAPRRAVPTAQRLVAPDSRPPLAARPHEAPRAQEAQPRSRAHYQRPIPDGYQGYGPAYGGPIELGGANGAWVVALVIVSVAVLWFAWGPQTQETLSRWASRAGIASVAEKLESSIVPRAPDDRVVVGPPSITPQQIDAVLADYGSPAAGSGQTFYDVGVRYGIDPAYALAFFIHESSAGTASQWAGNKPDGTTTHNVGNIICAGYATCYGRFRDYPSWEAGIEDWYRLIAVEYIEGRGLTTVDQILPIYAPSFENDVDGYVNTVQGLVARWRGVERGN